MRVSRLGYTAVRSTVALWSVWVLVGTFHVTGYARQDRSVAEGVYSDSQATRGEGTYRHVYIKARTPQLNGKVERCHRTDKQEFLSAPDVHGRRRSQPEAGRMGELLQLPPAPRSVPGQDALRSASREARMSYIVTVHRGRTHHSSRNSTASCP